MAGLSGLSAKMVAAFLGTTVAVGGGSMLIKNDQGQPIIQSLLSSSAEIETAPAPVENQEEQVAALSESKAEAPAATPAIKVPELPSFDIMRVEKDGSVVIAGKAPADSDVEIVENGKVLGKTRSGADGDFAIVFDTPLSVGDHELTIRATPKSSEPLLSAETGIVTIPELDDVEGEVLALVQKPGAASRILQAPKIEAVPEVVEETVETALLAEPDTDTGEPVETKPETQETVEDVATEEIKPVVKPADQTVLVQAVDVEPNKLFIAGKGEPNRRAQVYINGDFKGTVKIGQEGTFLFELDEGLNAGKHDLRVDLLGKDEAEVASRAAVTIDHAPEPVAVAEVEPEPIKEPEPVVAAEAVTEKVEEELVVAVAPVVPKPEPVEEVAQIEAKPEATKQVAEVPSVETEPLKQVIQTGRSVIIRRGDNLWKISRRMLGEGRKYTMIFSANTQQIEDPNRIYPGQVFDVPDEETEQADTQQKQSG